MNWLMYVLGFSTIVLLCLVWNNKPSDPMSMDEAQFQQSNKIDKSKFLKPVIFLVVVCISGALLYWGKEKIVETFGNSGETKVLEKDYPGAINDFNLVIKLQPNYFNGYSGRGTSKAELGNYNGAIKDYTEAMKIMPFRASNYFSRAMCKAHIKDYKGAILDYTKSIKLSFSNPDVYYFRGISKANIGDYKGAIADYNKAISADANYGDIFFYRGKSKAQLKNYSGAIADFTRAITLKETHRDIYTGYAEMSVIQNKEVQKDGDLIGVYMDYRSLIVDLFDIYLNRGLSKSAQGDRDGAILDLSTVVNTDPKCIEAYYTRALNQLKMEEYDLAISDYTKVIKLNPNYLDAYYLRGVIRTEIEDYTGAISDLEHAKTLYLNRNNMKKYKLVLNLLKSLRSTISSSDT